MTLRPLEEIRRDLRDRETDARACSGLLATARSTESKAKVSLDKAEADYAPLAEKYIALERAIREEDPPPARGALARAESSRRHAALRAEGARARHAEARAAVADLEGRLANAQSAAAECERDIAAHPATVHAAVAEPSLAYLAAVVQAVDAFRKIDAAIRAARVAGCGTDYEWSTARVDGVHSLQPLLVALERDHARVPGDKLFEEMRYWSECPRESSEREANHRASQLMSFVGAILASPAATAARRAEFRELLERTGRHMNFGAAVEEKRVANVEHDRYRIEAGLNEAHARRDDRARQIAAGTWKGPAPLKNFIEHNVRFIGPPGATPAPPSTLAKTLGKAVSFVRGGPAGEPIASLVAEASAPPTAALSHVLDAICEVPTR
jgi:hypothetical protein